MPPRACRTFAPPQEALPTPFGLVRSGVAPDHADTKVGGAATVWRHGGTQHERGPTSRCGRCRYPPPCRPHPSSSPPAALRASLLCSAHAPTHPPPPPPRPHPQNVINQFTQLAQGDPRLGFLGNVRVGRDVSLPELRSFYNAVVLAYGAESDRRLGVPGEVRCARWLCAPGRGMRGTAVARRGRAARARLLARRRPAAAGGSSWVREPRVPRPAQPPTSSRPAPAAAPAGPDGRVFGARVCVVVQRAPRLPRPAPGPGRHALRGHRGAGQRGRCAPAGPSWRPPWVLAGWRAGFRGRAGRCTPGMP